MVHSEAMNQQASLEQPEANLFELQGYDTQIIYSTSSIIGQPQFTYNDPSVSLTFTGSEILVEDTGLRRIVTVMLKNNQADEGFESLTLLLPAVQLSTEMRTVSIQTLAILSRRFIFVVPGARQLQTYNSLNLFGTAQFVQF